MGWGSPLCEQLREQIVLQFKNVSQHTMQETEEFLHLQSIISSKHSENLEKSLHVSGNAENQHWMPVTFDPSGGTALKTNITFCGNESTFQIVFGKSWTSCLCLFQQDNKDKSAGTRLAYLQSRPVSHGKFWSQLSSAKYDSGGSRTVEQLKSYIKQEWEKFHQQHVNNWCPQFPNAYWVLLKGKAMKHSGKHVAVPARVAGIKIKMSEYLQK